MSRKTKIILAISIPLAILIGFFPSFAGARGMSAGQLCVCNLRHIDIGVALFNLEDDQRLQQATCAYSKMRIAHGLPVPPTATLTELISDRYLAKQDIGSLSDQEVTVYLNPEKVTGRSEWVRVRWPDGFEISQLVDGNFTDGKYPIKWWQWIP